MLEKEKSIREEIEKTGDLGGGLHLDLAKCLLEQKKYDDAGENLLFCLGADTMVRDCAYPLIVDLLSQGKCIDLVPHMTFEWLRLNCYIEPDKKKAMYMGIAFGTDKLNKIANALDCYILDFGGDENVGAMYDRLENLTFEQMPNVDFYDYCYFEAAHDALCEAVDKGLDLAKLSDVRLACMYNYTDDEEIALAIRRFIIENRNRHEMSNSMLESFFPDLEIASQLAAYYIWKKDYEVLTWLYIQNKTDCYWDYNDVNDEFFGPIINCILASNDAQVVSDFIKANEDSFGPIYSDYRYYICEFVSNHYLDENGNVRDEWCDLTEVFTMLVDMIFDTFTEEDVERTFGCFNRLFVKNAFETCRNYFTDEALENNFELSDGELWFSTIYGYTFITQNKEGLLEDIKNAFRMVKEKYFN